MIVTSDIYKIIHDSVISLNLGKIHNGWAKVKGRLKEEAVVIVVSNPIEDGTYWEETTVHVNFCVPNLPGEPDTARLNEVERIADGWIGKGITGKCDGSAYTYSKASIGIEEDDALKCCYVNLVLDFRILNVM